MWLRVCSLARKGVALEVALASRGKGLALCYVISCFQINTKGKAPHEGKLNCSLSTSAAVHLGTGTFSCMLSLHQLT